MAAPNATNAGELAWRGDAIGILEWLTYDANHTTDDLPHEYSKAISRRSGAAMTTPQERTRAIGSGADLLVVIERDESIPVAVRERARELGRRCPSASELRDWLVAGEDGLLDGWGEAIGGTYQLSIDIQWPIVGCVATRRESVVRLHDFPHFWIPESIAKGTEYISRWLLPTDDFR